MSTLAKPKLRPEALPPRSAPEDLVEVVDFLRLDATRRLDPDRQVEMGQFMTPGPVARLMASMFEARGRVLRLLDAGAGIGSLTAAWVADLSARKRSPAQISVTAYELDLALAEQLELTLQACASHCQRAGVRFEGEVRREDFIEAGIASLPGRLFPRGREEFDCAILNPPYRKIHTDSRTRRLMEALGAETNLYTAFLSIAVALLKPGGELVAITPRSFCNGPYFRSFRQRFLDEVVLRRIHSFEARDRAFSEDEVLQENVILHAIKRPPEGLAGWPCRPALVQRTVPHLSQRVGRPDHQAW